MTLGSYTILGINIIPVAGTGALDVAVAVQNSCADGWRLHFATMCTYPTTDDIHDIASAQRGNRLYSETFAKHFFGWVTLHFEKF